MKEIDVPYLHQPKIFMPPMPLPLVFQSNTIKGQLKRPKYHWKLFFSYKVFYANGKIILLNII
jgi:hypothetical protein